MRDEERAPARQRRRRWGLWALAFLALASSVVLTSGEGYTPTGACLVLASLTAAGYCSYRGLRQFTWLPR